MVDECGKGAGRGASFHPEHNYRCCCGSGEAGDARSASVVRRWVNASLSTGSYEAVEVKPRSKCLLPHLLSSLSWWNRRLLLPGRNALRIGRTSSAHTQLLSGRLPATVCRIRPPIPLAAGAAFRWRGPSVHRRLSARPWIGHTPPGPAPTASGRTGTMRSRDQPSLAPVGTRPVSENRHSAISSLRASATIITRRMRPRAPAVRSLNHLLSALSG